MGNGDAVDTGVRNGDVSDTGVKNGNAAMSIEMDPPKILHTRKPIHLEFRNITYTVPQGKKGTRTILNNVSGFVQPGEMLAIMGPSGCGKTTLLNLLAKRSKMKYEGQILVNGKYLDKHYKYVSAYVQQDDVFLANLSVREQLLYSAELRLPRDVPMSEKVTRALEVEKELGLGRCANTLIGSELARGVSGGERKRTSIGVEIIPDPSIMFLDEPTSGLDAYTAKCLMDTLKELTASGRTIVLSIHQPRPDIFAMFDKVLLMSAGEVVYFGVGGEACVEYFTANGVQCPRFANPADYLMDIITAENAERISGGLREDGSELLVTTFVKQYPVRSLPLLGGLACEWADPKKYPPVEQPAAPYRKKLKFGASYSQQLHILFERAFKNLYRDKMATVVRMITAIIMGVIIGWIFIKGEENQTLLQDHAGAMFLLLMGQTFPVATAALTSFIVQRPVFNREHQSGMYHTSTFFLTKLLVELPLILVATIIQTTIPYWMIGFNVHAGRYFTFIILICLVALVSTAISTMISCVARNLQIATVIMPVVFVISSIFAGYFRNSTNFPSFWIWMEYISFYRYSFQGLLCNDLQGRPISCDPDELVGGECPITIGDTYLTDSLGFDCGLKWAYVGILAGMYVFYMFLAYLGLRLKSRSG